MQLQPSLHHRQAARRTQMEAERSSLAGPQASRRVLRRHILSSVAAPSLQIGYFVARVPAADRPALRYETLTQPVRQLAHACCCLPPREANCLRLRPAATVRSAAGRLCLPLHSACAPQPRKSQPEELAACSCSRHWPY